MLLSQLRTSKHFAVAVVTLGIFTDITIYSIIIPIVPFILEQLKEPESWVGILLAIYGLGVIIGSIAFGVLVTKNITSKKYVMLGSLVIVWLSILFFAVSKTIWMLAAARLCQGLASTGVWIMGFALVADYYHNDQANLGVVMSIIMSGLSLGMLAGPPIGGALYGVNEHAPFIFCAALVFLDLVGRILIADPSTLPSSVMTEETLETGNGSQSLIMVDASQSQSSTLTLAPANESALEQVESGKSAEFMTLEATTTAIMDSQPSHLPNTDIKPEPISIGALFKMKALWVAAVFCAVMAICFTQLEPTLPLYLNKLYGYNSAQIGVVWLALVIPNVAGGLLGGYSFDKLGMRRTCMIGMPASAVALFVLAIPGPSSSSSSSTSSSIVWTCAVLVFAGFILGFGSAPMMPAIAASVPKEYYTLGYALMNFMFSFGIAIGPLAGSFVFQYLGWMWQMLVFGIFLTLMTPMILLM
ncbi:hypothetical protein CcCBS67573_g05752 [Chytriomyces confervae]|uniref:Major facilitator superfamily (MFS) profile domain-containing protein n=1 Tax=Chytriomyces confervae TaxID=246404 RepID=A0A507F8W5_9FUNG|nr:hypothetical protein CcCBS67573_g05752 [Chytriomyces confervae]